MLVLTRRSGQSVLLSPKSDLDPKMQVADLFAGGPVTVTVLAVRGDQIKLGIEAPTSVRVMREELVEG